MIGRWRSWIPKQSDMALRISVVSQRKGNGGTYVQGGISIIGWLNGTSYESGEVCASTEAFARAKKAVQISKKKRARRNPHVSRWSPNPGEALLAPRLRTSRGLKKQ